MMPTGVMVISAMVIPVPPASRLGLVREEYAAEQKCHERTNDDFHGYNSASSKMKTLWRVGLILVNKINVDRVHLPIYPMVFECIYFNGRDGHGLVRRRAAAGIEAIDGGDQKY